MIGAWEQLPMPVIAAIDGVALGKRPCAGNIYLYNYTVLELQSFWWLWVGLLTSIGLASAIIY